MLNMEGFSHLISEERRLGRLQGIKITNNFILTHLLFVDDVLIFLNGGVGDLTYLHSVMLLFSTTIGME